MTQMALDLHSMRLEWCWKGRQKSFGITYSTVAYDANSKWYLKNWERSTFLLRCLVINNNCNACSCVYHYQRPGVGEPACKGDELILLVYISFVYYPCGPYSDACTLQPKKRGAYFSRWGPIFSELHLHTAEGSSTLGLGRAGKAIHRPRYKLYIHRLKNSKVGLVD